MKSIGELLKNFKSPMVRGAATRALMLEAANGWIRANAPDLAARSEARAIVGNAMVIQCQSGLIASEVRFRKEALLAALRLQFGEAAPQSLKCTVREGNLAEWQAEAKTAIYDA
jgi:hypothetical protein